MSANAIEAGSSVLEREWVVAPESERPTVFDLPVAEEQWTQPPLPLFESFVSAQKPAEELYASSPETEWRAGRFHEPIAESTTPPFVVPHDQLALFADTLEEQDALYRQRLGLLYDEKTDGAAPKDQFPKALASLNKAFGKPKEWDVVDEIALCRRDIQDPRRASWQYLMGANPQTDQSYNQLVHTPYGELNAHKQEFRLGELQDYEEQVEDAAETIDALDAARFRVLPRARKYVELGAPYAATAIHFREEVDAWIKADPTLVRRTAGTAAKFAINVGAAMAAASCAFGPVTPPEPATPSPQPEVAFYPDPPDDMVAVTPPASAEPPNNPIETGGLHTVAGLSSVAPGQGDVLSVAPYTDPIADALNEQGVAPFVGRDSDGKPIFSVTVSLEGGNDVCVFAVPDQIADKNDITNVFRLVPDGETGPVVGFGSPDMIGDIGDSKGVVRYGAVNSDGQPEIAAALAPAVPAEEGTACALAVVTDADKTPNPNDFAGAVAAVSFDAQGNITSSISPLLVDPSENSIVAKPDGTVLLDGKPMESTLWVNDATPPPTAPPTPEATATTPPQEFACWEPGGEDEVNQLEFANLAEQMPLLVAEENSCLEDWGITTESIVPIRTEGRVGFNKEIAPYTFLTIWLTRGYDANQQDKPRFVVTSANKVLMPSGNENWVIGVAMKREGSDQLGIFHFMIDRAAMEHLRDILATQNSSLPPEDLSDDAMLAFLNSDRLQQGFRVSPFIVYPGGPEYPDNFIHWGDSVKLIQTQLAQTPPPADLGITGVGINSWALAPSLSPNNTSNTPEWEEAYLAWAKTKIFPVLTFISEAKAP